MGERASGSAFLKWRNIVLKWRASFSRNEACSHRIRRSGQEPSSVLCCLCRRGAILCCTALAAVPCGAGAVFTAISYLCAQCQMWDIWQPGDPGEELAMGTLSRTVQWSSLRKATQSYLMGSSLRTALISGSSSLPVGVNVVRGAVHKH